eukprot:179857-Rhodomonas_salina.2
MEQHSGVSESGRAQVTMLKTCRAPGDVSTSNQSLLRYPLQPDLTAVPLCLPRRCTKSDSDIRCRHRSCATFPSWAPDAAALTLPFCLRLSDPSSPSTCLLSLAEKEQTKAQSQKSPS